MGDDAEFQIEFEKYGPWWEELEDDSNPDPELDPAERACLDFPSVLGGAPLLLLGDGPPKAIWHWDESIPIPYTLEDLHSHWGIGTRISWCDELPSSFESAARPAPPLTDRPAFEVLLVTHDDEIVLEAAADELMQLDHQLRERMVGEMLEIMLRIVQSSPAQSDFAFVRVLRRFPAGI